ncbi:MAG: MBOAT family protein [Lachnospiraceae bacterium]|nr:MBOAT family protein [Lachnospiraceae bacterium]
MVFSTIIFLCAFLPITIIGYYLMPGRGKNIFLLLLSLLFYAWGEPTYVLVMLFSILCNYTFGMILAECKENFRKLWIIMAIVVNLGVLGVFKYTGFVVSSLSGLIPGLLKIPEIALPIGISFYTFQGLSYCIDVYRDKSIVQKNPINLALYISMFPQLIAGPIVRYTDIRTHLHKRTHSAELFCVGAERFIVGLGKKAIFANTMGALADQIMGSNVQYLSAPVAWIGAIAYTLQIYFDFSGYSDMAIGLGKIFGFHFPENFNYPYISKSVREF